MKILSVGAEFFHKDMTKLIAAYRKFLKASKNVQLFSSRYVDVQ
jgi:hypothetical protein